MNQKLIVILGPTACGKTKIATALAAKYNGEIVSADSRQVYRGMDIGTGKDLRDYAVKLKVKSLKLKVVKIPYHLIDVVSPMTPFNVAKYQKMAYGAINDVLERGRVPFLVGGTGLYIDAVVKGFVLNQLRITNYEFQELRKKLDNLTLRQLLVKLEKIDPKTFGIIDKENRRRVQRALEIYYETGVPKSKLPENIKPPYEVLIIGIKFPLEKIYQKIDARMQDWFGMGLLNEVKKLHKGGVTWKRLEEFGLEYLWVSRYLRKKVSREEMMENLKNDLHHFAKRQLTWFKRNDDIQWVTSLAQANKLAKEFIKKRP